jgi:hypothetical protein
MKKILFLGLILLISCFVKGQSILDSSAYKTCLQRGHIKPEVFQMTSLDCGAYIEDTDTTTIMVYPGCNWITYTCVRCGRDIKEKEPTTRITIWRKEHIYTKRECDTLDKIFQINTPKAEND